MATLHLNASGYTGLSGMSTSSSYPVTNAYKDTDSTSGYARFSISTSTTGLVYFTFDCSDIPSNANNISITGSARLRISSTSRVSNRTCQVYTGTTAKGSSVSWSSTSSGGEVVTLSPGSSWTRSELNDLRLKIGGTGSSSSSSKYIYVYGIELDITYVTESRTVTTTLTGNGTISPSGATSTYDGEEFELTITPTNTSDPVTVTNNGTDVTSQLVEHYAGGTSTSTSQTAGSEVTTGFARSGGAFYQSSSTSSDAWLRYAIGHTAESPYSTSNTSNTYCKDGTNDATTQGWMNYPFDFSSIPATAEIDSVEVKCYGAAEDTSQSASHADVSLWCGNVQKGTTQTFSSTSNSTMTISDPGEWDREELQDAWLRFGVGYYGGRILGITWKVNYTYGGTLHHYTYTYEVNGNATIAVVIGTASGPKMYVKLNGTWTEFSKVYMKVNGAWVEQSSSTWSSLFNTSTNYRKMT